MLRCSLKDSASSVVIGKRDVSSDTAPTDVSFVKSITITNAGVDVALITEHLSARVFDNSTDVQVTGKIPGSGAERGYLEIVWKNPGSAQAGSYKCEVGGLGQSGHYHDFSKTLDVATDEVSLSDVVGYIHRLKLDNELQTTAIGGFNLTIADLKSSNAGLRVKVNNLETSNADLQKSNADLNSSNSDLKMKVKNLETANSDLKVKVNSLQTSNADLQKSNTDLQNSTADLKTKVDTHVMFTAWRNGDVTLSYPQVLVFNILITNIGGGYNSSTGVFTAPVAGFYTFHVHVMGQKGKEALVWLYHNDIIMASAWADDGLDYQSASTSADLQLQQGDTVKVTSGGTSYVEGSYYYTTSFSGHLVAMD